MDKKFKDIRAVGFDLDGTLYESVPGMDERIHEEAGKKILEKKPEIGSVEAAAAYYVKKFEELESGSRTLMAVGYGKLEALEAMREVLENADITDMIPADPELVEILKEIKGKYYSYLITKSPRDLAREKLRKIGIHDDHFSAEFFGDDPILIAKQKGEALTEVAKISGTPLEEHVYVGDRLKADIIEPRALGIKTIAVWTEIPEADVSIPHIHDIKKILL